MRSISPRQLALPVFAGLATSAAVAALGIAGQAGTAAAPSPPTPTGQVAGQLTLGNGSPIPILSFSAGVSNTVTFAGGGGGGTGKASFTALNLIKAIDANSPGLFVKVATGQHFANAVFTAQWGSGSSTATMKYELESVVLESLQQSGAGTGAGTESLSIVFGKVTWTYTDAAGTTSGSWDIVNNSAG